MFNDHQEKSNWDDQETNWDNIDTAEETCFSQYDRDMATAVAEADYQDYCYDYQNDSLLELVVGVQSYLTEQQAASSNKSYDSPLYNLQYKLYTYMRQRALELGMEF